MFPAAKLLELSYELITVLLLGWDIFVRSMIQFFKKLGFVLNDHLSMINLLMDCVRFRIVRTFDSSVLKLCLYLITNEA